jgi:ankyrin repeat protein
MLAIIGGYKDIAFILIAYGVYINQCNIEGNTALHMACDISSLSLVSVLVAKGALLDAQDNDMKTPLMHATRIGNREIVEYLLENGAVKENIN